MATLHPSEQEVVRALDLIERAGLPTDWMCAGHRRIGATMRERTGRVSAWISAMERPRYRATIATLLEVIHDSH